jgi:hypothetical protein
MTLVACLHVPGDVRSVFIPMPKRTRRIHPNSKADGEGKASACQQLNLDRPSRNREMAPECLAPQTICAEARVQIARPKTNR